MKIFGIIDDYGTYNKIPITDKDWFEEYEYGIEALFSHINLNLRPCKTLRRQTDIIWLRKYLQVIERFIIRNENMGVSYTTKEIFSLFKIPCIRERFFCKYKIDIYDGLGIRDKKILPRDECYLYGRCSDVVYYDLIEEEGNNVIRISIEDVYNYDDYAFHVKQGNVLHPISFEVKDYYVYIREDVLPEDIVVKNGTCFYGLTDGGTTCEAEATGVYLSNGDYEITLNPLDADISKLSIEIDGLTKVIDDSSIIYNEGKIVFKNAYNYNYIRLVGCPNVLFEIGGGCAYSFSLSVTGDKATILIAGGNVSPNTEDINITMNNTTFSNYNYNDNKITFDVDPSYIGQGFILRIANCIFGFGLYKEDDVIVVKETPIITEEIFTRCVGMDKLTIKRKYVLSLDSPIPNTWIPEEELLSTEANGCRESLTVERYKCEDGNKLKQSQTLYKGYGDPSFPDPVWDDTAEWTNVGLAPECEKQGSYEDIDGGIESRCDGCDKKTYQITWVYNEELEVYEKEEELLSTEANGCKNTFLVDKYICDYENDEYCIKHYHEVYKKCANSVNWEYVEDILTATYPICSYDPPINIDCGSETLGNVYHSLGQAPIADFNLILDNMGTHFELTVINLSIERPSQTYYEWYINEVSFASDKNPSLYSFFEEGHYIVTLVASNEYGLTKKKVEFDAYF